jgi:hypothetical protein
MDWIETVKKKVSPKRLQICVGHLQLSQKAIGIKHAWCLSSSNKYVNIRIHYKHESTLQNYKRSVFFFSFYLINRKSCIMYYICVCLPPIFALTPSNRRFISKLSASPPLFFILFFSSHHRRLLDTVNNTCVRAILHSTYVYVYTEKYV